MAKQGEIAYLQKLGPLGAVHAQGKPFSDPGCGRMLADIGGMLMVLPPAPARLLDLGCGSGWTSVFFAQRGYDVVGQDIAPDMIALAQENKQRAGVVHLDFRVADYEDLSFQNEFDCAVFYDALHHAEDPNAALQSAYRALKPDGVLITVEPGAGHAAAEISLQAMREFGVTERDMPPRTILRMAKTIGFRGARVYPTPKMLAMLQYEIPKLANWPAWLSDIIRWGGMGYLMLLAKHWRGGMVVLRK